MFFDKFARWLGHVIAGLILALWGLYIIIGGTSLFYKVLIVLENWRKEVHSGGELLIVSILPAWLFITMWGLGVMFLYWGWVHLRAKKVV